MKKIVYFLILIFAVGMLNSCVTAPVKPVETPAKETYPPLPPTISRKDVLHTVAPGETLWRLSKMYDVPMKEIALENNLTSKTIEKGQRLSVPNAAPIVPVVPLYPSKKWKYIIIHHSATDEGSSLHFDNYHLNKGWEGIGYHFVIDNGTKGKEDGQIEVSPRWLKQEDGAHCKAGNMNLKSIGICLVGDFNRDEVSDKQMDSLVYLVNLLRRKYHIPATNILGHGQVYGAKTECPGRYFAWQEFYRKLNSE